MDDEGAPAFAPLDDLNGAVFARPSNDLAQESFAPQEMIRFTCQMCGKPLKAPPGIVGRPGKCPTCGTPCIVPRANFRFAEMPLALTDFELPAAW